MPGRGPPSLVPVSASVRPILPEQTVCLPNIDGADRRGAKFMTAELFGDGFDFAGTDPLDVHLGQGAHQGLFTALVTLKEFTRETPLADLGAPVIPLFLPW
jgi:hypothetical protein